MAERILLVDDREDSLLSLESILESNNYRFVKAHSGIQALKILLNETDFALILMDVQMPDLDGFETASLIYQREKLRHIPIIFITANNFGDENIFKGYRSGAVDYIYKPVNTELLKVKVAVFVELYKKNHQLMAQEQKLKVINGSLEIEINERRASEEQVKELNRRLIENIDRLESANKDLDSFAFMASHDLQEPLRKILTFTDMLVSKFSGLQNEESKKCVKSIQNSAIRMQVLIEDLLTFSRVTSDNGFKGFCDLNSILEEVIKDMEFKIEEKKALVTMERLPSVPGNANLLKSLFANLLENALKYSQKNETPHITIGCDSESSNGGLIHDHLGDKFCRITFKDNGIGFEQEYADQIFNMFKRLHNSKEYEGTGIGLAICKKIVEKHGGYISAKGELGRGSLFIVTLPVETAVRLK